jgi:hypothetical protein
MIEDVAPFVQSDPDRLGISVSFRHYLIILKIKYIGQIPHLEFTALKSLSNKLSTL